jgi:hypothetical protein
MTFGGDRHIGGTFWGWQAHGHMAGQIPYGGKAELGVFYRHSGVRTRLLAALPAGLSLCLLVCAILRFNVVGYNDTAGDGDEGFGVGVVGLEGGGGGQGAPVSPGEGAR